MDVLMILLDQVTFRDPLAPPIVGPCRYDAMVKGAISMPEQITRYPDVTLRVLKGAGAVCGEGAPRKILTQCPAARFCALPSAEICVYGIDEISNMTQISTREIAAVVAPACQPDAMPLLTTWWVEGVILGTGLLAGFALGKYMKMR